MGFLSIFSPLNDDPTKGERARACPISFAANELTYAQGAYNRQWPLSFPVLIPAINGFFGLQNQFEAAMAYGKKPYGPFTGDIPQDAFLNAFRNTWGGMRKVTG